MIEISHSISIEKLPSNISDITFPSFFGPQVGQRT